jgi:hypothetical protein
LTSNLTFPLFPSSGNCFSRVNPSMILIGLNRSVRNPTLAYAFQVWRSTAARNRKRVTRSSTAPVVECFWSAIATIVRGRHYTRI